MIITTSWDDGYPADGRLAELLKKSSVAGTFFVPCRNSEGRPVIGGSNLREIYGHFEIAAHTLDHVDLTTLTHGEAERQICEGKQRLESILGAEVCGFCYPRGKFNDRIRRVTIDAGFAYARGVKNFCSSADRDPFALPVTLQFFPHRKSVYLTNLLKYGEKLKRMQLFLAAVSTDNLVDRVKRVVDFCQDSSSVFHLWGHSWEIDEHDLWRELDNVLCYLRRTFPHATFATNAKVVERACIQFSRG